MRLKDKVAIVTGAGRGIGRAIALAYAREGASVVVNYNRSHNAADDAVQQIRDAGGSAIAVRADIACLDDHDTLLAATLQAFGALHILVNNAGVEVNEPVLESRPATWDHTLDVNLKGAYFLSVKAAEAMRRTGGGKIVNISSVHDVEPLRDRAIYSISKGGLLMMTKSLALELAPHHIRVNAIAPGAILTDMNRAHLEQPARRERLLAQIPLQRVGDPEDIAGAAIYLASKESDYVTGTTIYVDGGLLL
jgi:glucose 1-dehydrogenase